MVVVGVGLLCDLFFDVDCNERVHFVWGQVDGRGLVEENKGMLNEAGRGVHPLQTERTFQMARPMMRAIMAITAVSSKQNFWFSHHMRFLRRFALFWKREA